MLRPSKEACRHVVLLLPDLNTWKICIQTHTVNKGKTEIWKCPWCTLIILFNSWGAVAHQYLDKELRTSSVGLADEILHLLLIEGKSCLLEELRATLKWRRTSKIRGWHIVFNESALPSVFIRPHKNDFCRFLKWLEKLKEEQEYFLKVFPSGSQ